MFIPSRLLSAFFIAGFQYHDGALVLNRLKPGKKLHMVPEFDNPYDHDAIALYRKTVHIGYVPAATNELFAQLLRFGHSDVLECRILQVNKKANPWEQVRVGIYVKDKRQDHKKGK